MSLKLLTGKHKCVMRNVSHSTTDMISKISWDIMKFCSPNPILKDNGAVSYLNLCLWFTKIIADLVTDHKKNCQNRHKPSQKITILSDIFFRPTKGHKHTQTQTYIFFEHCQCHVDGKYYDPGRNTFCCVKWVLLLISSWWERQKYKIK